MRWDFVAVGGCRRPGPEGMIELVNKPVKLGDIVRLDAVQYLSVLSIKSQDRGNATSNPVRSPPSPNIHRVSAGHGIVLAQHIADLTERRRGKCGSKPLRRTAVFAEPPCSTGTLVHTPHRHTSLAPSLRHARHDFFRCPLLPSRLCAIQNTAHPRCPTLFAAPPRPESLGNSGSHAQDAGYHVGLSQHSRLPSPAALQDAPPTPTRQMRMRMMRKRMRMKMMRMLMTAVKEMSMMIMPHSESTGNARRDCGIRVSDTVHAPAQITPRSTKQNRCHETTRSSRCICHEIRVS
eukprot:30033-Rhodomonas_salina.7